MIFKVILIIHKAILSVSFCKYCPPYSSKYNSELGRAVAQVWVLSCCLPRGLVLLSCCQPSWHRLAAAGVTVQTSGQFGGS